VLSDLSLQKPEWILGTGFKQEAQLSQRDCAMLASVLTLTKFATLRF